MKKESMTISEIEKKLAEVREKIRANRFAGAGSQSKNVKEVGTLRKEIAQLETMKTSIVSKK